MKKILFILIILLLIPFKVYGESCDTDKITIDSIELEEKTENVVELEEPTANGNNINFNLSLSVVGDQVKYKVYLRNTSDEDFEIDESIFNKKFSYMSYSIATDDGSNIIKANSSKTVYLIAKYNNEVPASSFESGIYSEKNSIVVQLDNPNTFSGTYLLLIIPVLVVTIGLIIILRKNKVARYIVLIIGTGIIIPLTVYATCKYEITLTTDIQIVKIAEFASGELLSNKMDKLANGRQNVQSFKRSSELPNNIKTLVETQSNNNPDTEATDTEVDNKLQEILNDPDTVISSNVRRTSGQIYCDNNGNCTTTGESKVCGFNKNNPNECYTNEELTNKLRTDFVYISVSSSGDLSYYTYISESDSYSILQVDDFKEVLRKKITREKIQSPNILSSSRSEELIYGWYNDSDHTIYYYSPIETIYLYPNSSNMFYYYLNLSSAPGIENVKTNNLINTSRMFSLTGKNANSFNVNLSNWDTSKVTNMSNMFEQSGYNATTWNIGDISNWNVSSVKTMEKMFYSAGYSAQAFNIDVSKWDTSNLTNMSYLFYNAGYSAPTWSIGNLTNWKVSNVIYLNYTFAYAGYSATTWNIGNLSNWDTSNVTTIDALFYWAGYNASTWDIGNLSKWKTSKIENMEFAFSSAGYHATTWNVGDLSNWDTSKVTKTSNMFNSAGYSATTWSIGNLSNWNVSNVTIITNMFANSGYNSPTWGIGDLSNWDTRNVKEAFGLFQNAGYNATTWESIGTLNLYVLKMGWLFYSCPRAKAIINIHTKPTETAMAFTNAATSSDANIVVNYSSEVTNMDEIMGTKSPNSKVTIGNLLTE